MSEQMTKQESSQDATFREAAKKLAKKMRRETRITARIAQHDEMLKQVELASKGLTAQRAAEMLEETDAEIGAQVERATEFAAAAEFMDKATAVTGEDQRLKNILEAAREHRKDREWKIGAAITRENRQKQREEYKKAGKSDYLPTPALLPRSLKGVLGQVD